MSDITLGEFVSRVGLMPLLLMFWGVGCLAGSCARWLDRLLFGRPERARYVDTRTGATYSSRAQWENEVTGND